MPSEDKMLSALKVVAVERDAFRTALTGALEQVRGMMAAGNHASAMPDRIASELGAFAAGRIQFDRFAEIAVDDVKPKKAELNAIRHAQQLLAATLAMGDALHLVDVPPGGDMHATVHEALSMAGRAFAAAHAIEALRTGREPASHAEAMLTPLPPEQWRRAERDIAPPLVVHVHGDDLCLNGFEDLLQGSQKFVLLVEGAAPPAALARLISPSVLVMQCRATEDLARVIDHEGPAIAAVLNEPAAVFTYALGKLDVDYLPNELPKRALRTATVYRQREDLEWLRQLEHMMQKREVVELATSPAAESVQPGDKLAAWLLRQVEVPNP